MSSGHFASLASLSDVRIFAAVDPESLSKLTGNSNIPLPSDHIALLNDTNGAQAYGGYLTLFGVGPEPNPDAVAWNDPEYWKFAWGSRCSDYWCFAETAWGDQYAYSIPEMRKGRFQVYLLDCLAMVPTLIADSFSEFWEDEFLRSAMNPYDVMMVEARKLFGDLQIGEHLVYVPSLIIGGREDISNVRKMEARAAMICNGDIASQVDAAGANDCAVASVTPFIDDKGRMRISINWT
jgi:hypothetical protein